MQELLFKSGLLCPNLGLFDHPIFRQIYFGETGSFNPLEPGNFFFLDFFTQISGSGVLSSTKTIERIS
jgi:hypothetical protein